MKKIFTIALLAATVLTVNASTRSWDFTNWGATTIANLMAGAGQVSPSNNWSDIEKSTATAPSETSANNCFWQVAVQTAGTTLQANGQDIAECYGLYFTNTAARALAIAVNYPTALSDYHGKSYLWLGSKNVNYFTIPNVKPGAIIKMGVESHKATEARGVQLFIGSNTGTQLKAPDGTDVATPTVYEDQTWQVPSDEITDTPNEDGTYNIVVRNTNGCHLYYITVNEGGDSEAAKNIAWVTADVNNDTPFIVRPTDNINYTDILASATDVTADSLRTFDAVVVSNNVTADAAMAKLLSDNIAYVPMVNLNTNLFGYTPADVANTTLTAVDKDNELFANTGMDENGSFEYTNIAVTLPERFASDNILAKNGDAVAIHQHTASRNSYILLPTNDQVVEKTAWLALLPNAISTVAATKKTITSVATPVISQNNEEGSTTVTITCSTAGSVVKYAIDEGAFKTYTEPFTVTSECTVYAYATAEGYTPMTEENATSLAIKVMSKAAAPYISFTEASDTATITITAEEGTTIYYNFTGSSVQTESAVYTEPIQIVENATVSAFVVKDGYLNSDVTSLDITGLIAMGETLSHFDANKTEWSNGESKTYYYCYLRGNNEKKYSVSENYTCKYAPENNDWALYTSGQQVVWESTSPQKNIGDISNYNPVRAIDNIAAGEITGGEITFGTTSSSTVYAEDGTTPLTNAAGTDSVAQDKPNAELVSNVQFQAPFSIITYVGSKPGKQGFDYMVSTDGENWTTIGTSPEAPTYTDAASKWRLWHRDVLKYNGTDKVYLKLKSISTDSYRIFDVFVKESSAEIAAIKNVAAADAETTATRKYMRNGQILIQTARGTFNTVGARIK